MPYFRTSRAVLFLSALVLSTGIALAQVALPVPSVSLCDSGRTPKALPPIGCLATGLVSPVNSFTGGPSIDGNWELATPYPSASNLQLPPDPCLKATAWGPAWVDAADPAWYNPSDGLSQWITPLDERYALPGWYIYRTGFTVPAPYPGFPGYFLNVTGQLLADNQTVSVYLLDAVGALTSCRAVAVLTNTGQYHSFTPFHFSTPVSPITHGYLYFVVDNSKGNTQNPTGLRVEFLSSYFYPY